MQSRTKPFLSGKRATCFEAAGQRLMEPEEDSHEQMD